MRKFTLDAWNRHIANIQIEGYGQGLAKAKMMAMVHALIIALEYGKITKEEYRSQLENNGFKDWSEEDLQDFAMGKHRRLLKIMRKEMILGKNTVKRERSRLEGY